MNKSAIKDFLKFVQKEVEPGISDLENLAEQNRVHVQKLVYTNLVDRFDTMIDVSLLENCREDVLLNIALKDLNSPIVESDLMRLLLQGENLQDAIDLKIKSGLRNSELRERHSKKLSTLFSLFKSEVNCWGAPRVNLATGVILEHIKPQGKTIPYSICGYADWLYSRRNSIVHGGGTNKFLANDASQLKKHFKVNPTTTFKIKLSSVKNAITFYKCVIDILNA